MRKVQSVCYVKEDWFVAPMHEWVPVFKIFGHLLVMQQFWFQWKNRQKNIYLICESFRCFVLRWINGITNKHPVINKKNLSVFWICMQFYVYSNLSYLICRIVAQMQVWLSMVYMCTARLSYAYANSKSNFFSLSWRAQKYAFTIFALKENGVPVVKMPLEATDLKHFMCSGFFFWGGGGGINKGC